MASVNNALEPVLATCAANRERDLNDLFTVVRQPSISAQNVGIREMADLLMGILDAAGGNQPAVRFHGLDRRHAPHPGDRARKDHPVGPGQ